MPINYREFVNKNFEYFITVSTSLKKCSKTLRSGNKNSYIYSIREFCNIEPHSFFIEYHEEIIKELNKNIKMLDKLEMYHHSNNDKKFKAIAETLNENSLLILLHFVAMIVYLSDEAYVPTIKYIEQHFPDIVT